MTKKILSYTLMCLSLATPPLFAAGPAAEGDTSPKSPVRGKTGETTPPATPTSQSSGPATPRSSRGSLVRDDTPPYVPSFSKSSSFTHPPEDGLFEIGIKLRELMKGLEEKLEQALTKKLNPELAQEKIAELVKTNSRKIVSILTDKVVPALHKGNPGYREANEATLDQIGSPRLRRKNISLPNDAYETLEKAYDEILELLNPRAAAELKGIEIKRKPVSRQSSLEKERPEPEVAASALPGIIEETEEMSSEQIKKIAQNILELLQNSIEQQPIE